MNKAPEVRLAPRKRMELKLMKNVDDDDDSPDNADHTFGFYGEATFGINE